MMSSQREEEKRYEDVGCKDDEVHRQTYAHEVDKMVATRHIYHQMCRRTDRCGEARRNAYHQSDAEGKRVDSHGRSNLDGYRGHEST